MKQEPKIKFNLKGYSSDFVLHIHNVGGSKETDLKNRMNKIKAAEIS